MKRTGITAPRGGFWMATLTATTCAVLLASVAATAQTKPATKPVAADSTRSARLGVRGSAVRTLDAINIEGEIAVPQVLFITARDVRRYRDGLGLKFQLSSTGAGQAAVLPARLRVGAQQSHKEE